MNSDCSVREIPCEPVPSSDRCQTFQLHWNGWVTPSLGVSDSKLLLLKKALILTPGDYRLWKRNMVVTEHKGPISITWTRRCCQLHSASSNGPLTGSTSFNWGYMMSCMKCFLTIYASSLPVLRVEWAGKGFLGRLGQRESRWVLLFWNKMLTVLIEWLQTNALLYLCRVKPVLQG